ncbi:hypothetical protein LTS18_004450 [Coniosporium uncinatum]|uniref:Uncharacterized protein n=1 Tax=Coniosporium uncinatum TaxID=93489 RepID=A0ACC3DSV4_9PEZI|nr:hypothetical protein LTS18_004450 [Coniosporium uncinatum]
MNQSFRYPTPRLSATPAPAVAEPVPPTAVISNIHKRARDAWTPLSQGNEPCSTLVHFGPDPSASKDPAFVRPPKRIRPAFRDKDDPPVVPFRLMGLPAELRVNVYRWYTRIQSRDSRRMHFLNGPLMHQDKFPPIVRVSRQVRDESFPVYLNEKTFVFKSHPSNEFASNLTTWTNRLDSAYVKGLNKINIDYHNDGRPSIALKYQATGPFPAGFVQVEYVMVKGTYSYRTSPVTVTTMLYKIEPSIGLESAPDRMNFSFPTKDVIAVAKVLHEATTGPNRRKARKAVHGRR